VTDVLRDAHFSYGKGESIQERFVNFEATALLEKEFGYPEKNPPWEKGKEKADIKKALSP